MPRDRGTASPVAGVRGRLAWLVPRCSWRFFGHAVDVSSHSPLCDDRGNLPQVPAPRDFAATDVSMLPLCGLMTDNISLHAQPQLSNFGVVLLQDDDVLGCIGSETGGNTPGEQDSQALHHVLEAGSVAKAGTPSEAGDQRGTLPQVTDPRDLAADVSVFFPLTWH